MWKLDKRLIDDFNKSEGRTAEAGNLLGFQDVVIRRRNSVELLRAQLIDEQGNARFTDPMDNRVVYSSTLVDVAGNLELLRETAEACNLILEHTAWQIRLLSKNSLLSKLVEKGLIPERHHRRIIFGFSTGTLDDRVAKAIEGGTALVSKRLEALHWLQDRGLRTFGMICPSLPQENYETFSKEICQAIRVERCEHVWAEVINVRGESLKQTLSDLRQAGLVDEAARVESVSTGGTGNWEEYARSTFLAHSNHVPSDKLRFLQYIEVGSKNWWASQRGRGAVLLGKVAEIHGLTAA